MSASAQSIFCRAQNPSCIASSAFCRTKVEGPIPLVFEIAEICEYSSFEKRTTIRRFRLTWFPFMSLHNTTRIFKLYGYSTAS